MSEPFPENVQESIFRLWDIIEAFYEDISAAEESGFYAMVGEKRKQDALLLIEYEVFRFLHDDSDKCEYCENLDLKYVGLGRRGLDAYEMICKDPERCRLSTEKYMKEMMDRKD